MKSTYLWFLLAASMVVLMAASSPECARSEDVSGPSLGTMVGPNDCENDCRAARRNSIREERRRHRLANKACNGEPSCLAEEEAMHQQVLAEIEADYQDCLTACAHQQGSGLGGQ